MSRNIIKNGYPNVGVIDTKDINFNYKEYQFKNFFDKEIKGIRKRFKFHHFNFIGIVSDKYILGIGIVDLGYLKNIFIYLFSYDDGIIYEYNKKMIATFSLKFPKEPSNYKISYKKAGNYLNIDKSFNDKKLKISGNIKGLSINAVFNYSFEENNPLRVVIPASYNGWTFTEKCSNILPEEIDINLKGKRIEFPIKETSLIYDWSGGYLKRETSWLWANFSGLQKNEENKRISANFAAMVNETFYSENIYWIDNQPFKKSQIEFIYDQNDPNSKWRFIDSEKKMDITFIPHHENKEKVNAIFVKTFFRQFLGKFSGYVTDSKDKKLYFKDLNGFVEIHRALW